MPHLIPNSFSSYSLTDQEVLEGSILTSLQQQCLQNQQAAIAEEKLHLEFNPAEPLTFVQQEAYKKGQLDMIAFLIDASVASNEELNQPTTIIED